MSVMAKWCYLMFLITLVLASGCSLFGPNYEEFSFQLLEFPFATPSHIERMSAFGIPNWSGTEPHNGIDLIIYESLSSTSILSPTYGTIESVEVSENPFSHPVNQLLLKINIYINSEWTVSMVIEPGTSDPATKNLQQSLVYVSEGQEVSPGQHIADLLVGEHGYPHLHFMVMNSDREVCAYSYSSASARSQFDLIKATRPGNYLPDGNICFGGI